jgi:hypothetical protein
MDLLALQKAWRAAARYRAVLNYPPTPSGRGRPSRVVGERLAWDEALELRARVEAEAAAADGLAPGASSWIRPLVALELENGAECLAAQARAA